MRRFWTPEAARRVRLFAAFALAWGVWLISYLKLFAFWRLVPAVFPPGTFLPLFFAYNLTLIAATAIVLLSFVGRRLGARKGSWAMAARRFPVFVTRVLPWLPAVFWLYFAGYIPLRRFVHPLVTGHVQPWMYGQMLGVIVGALGMTLLARWAIRRAAMGPIEEAPPEEPTDPNQTTFGAVAVTPTTWGIFVALCLFPFLFFFAMTHLSLSDAAALGAVLVYEAIAFLPIVLLRRVSRIKVGLDGVYVMGSGPARFWAWSRFDEVRAAGVEIVLLHRGRAVLRLQLHGADAARREAWRARFEEAMVAAAQAKNDAPHVFAAHAASAKETRPRSAGVHDYRSPAVSREQLWQVVEGRAAEPSVRVSAAEALVALAPEAGDLPRLRLATEQCADPRLRAALTELAEAVAEDEAARHASPRS